MITATSINRVMTKNVVTISSTDTIWDIEKIFRINHLRHAPVCEEGNVIGMVSLIDLRHFTPKEREDPSAPGTPKLTAAQIMAPDPVTLQSGQTIKEAAALFAENEFHAIPVLESGTLVGIISTTDIIPFLIDAIEEIEEQ